VSSNLTGVEFFGSCELDFGVNNPTLIRSVLVLA